MDILRGILKQCPLLGLDEPTEDELEKVGGRRLRSEKMEERFSEIRRCFGSLFVARFKRHTTAQSAGVHRTDILERGPCRSTNEEFLQPYNGRIQRRRLHITEWQHDRR